MAKFYNVPVNAVGITRIITCERKDKSIKEPPKSIFVFGDPATTKKDIRVTIDDDYIWVSAPDYENSSASTMFYYEDLK